MSNPKVSNDSQYAPEPKVKSSIKAAHGDYIHNKSMPNYLS